MRKLCIFVLFICVMTTSFAFRFNQQIITPTRDISINEVSVQEVKTAIIRACALLKWVLKEKNKNTIRASILVRNKHTVVVDIPYTANAYSIKYVNSINMKAKPDGSIHPNYNNWVMKLADQINQELVLSSIQ